MIRSAPRERLFPILGAILALGAPLGLLVVRAIDAGTPFSSAFYLQDLRQGSLTYAYSAISTLAVFVLLGWLLGRAEDELVFASLTDPVTGLANRRHFDARLAFELRRAERYGLPVALLVVDVDHLKWINDSDGHAAGDRALGLVGRTLRAACRSTDLAARSGGDEFAIIVPHATAAEAAELAHRAIEALDTAQHDDPSHRVTISIGVSDTQLAGDRDPGSLREAADLALYRAKREGGGRARISLPCGPSSGEETNAPREA
jgi:diguanylate cyclase (GGDEF)-like protein